MGPFPLQRSSIDSLLMKKLYTKVPILLIYWTVFTTAYDGSLCEQDIMKECETAGCHNTSKCMEKINGFECICPSSSGYTGDK